MSKILSLGKKLRDKEISCTELTKEYLNKAINSNPELNVYITITEEEALKKASEVDKKLFASEDLPLMAGIPYALKDNIVTSGIKTTNASKMLENYVPMYDAAVYESLSDAMAVLIGKNNLDEMSMGSTGANSFFGQTYNPLDTSYAPGGSSGGTASAVASGSVVFGLGTDSGGSVRQPASFCGLVGFKPSYGSVSRYGVFALASSLDHVGPIATNVTDAAIVYNTIKKYDKRDMRSLNCEDVKLPLKDDVRGVKIGIAKQFFDNLSSELTGTMQEAIGLYKKLGAKLIDINFPLLEYSMPLYYLISTAEAASNLGRFNGICYGYRPSTYDDVDDLVCKSRGEGLGKEVKKRIMLGTYFLSSKHRETYFDKAQKLKYAIINEFRRIFTQCDCILSPTLPITAVKVGAKRGIDKYYDDTYNAVANIAGLPAISIPCGFSNDGLPIGLEIIGNKYCDDVVLNTAYAFENETGGLFNRIFEGRAPL